MMAMKVIKRSVILLTIIVTQLFNTFCTRRIIPQLPAHNSSKKDMNHEKQAVISHDLENQISDNNIVESLAEHNSGEALIKPVSVTPLREAPDVSDLVIETAMTYMGVPHCYGGTTSRCMDCSGFVSVVFSKYGHFLPHNSQEQSYSGDKVADKKDLKKGDLVFFSGTYNNGRNITHTGIYIGNNEFIHASSGQGVTISSLDDPYWRRKYVFGVRILE